MDEPYVPPLTFFYYWWRERLATHLCREAWIVFYSPARTPGQYASHARGSLGLTHGDLKFCAGGKLQFGP